MAIPVEIPIPADVFAGIITKQPSLIKEAVAGDSTEVDSKMSAELEQMQAQMQARKLLIEQLTQQLATEMGLDMQLLRDQLALFQKADPKRFNELLDAFSKDPNEIKLERDPESGAVSVYLPNSPSGQAFVKFGSGLFWFAQYLLEQEQEETRELAEERKHAIAELQESAKEFAKMLEAEAALGAAPVAAYSEAGLALLPQRQELEASLEVALLELGMELGQKLSELGNVQLLELWALTSQALKDPDAVTALEAHCELNELNLQKRPELQQTAVETVDAKKEVDIDLSEMPAPSPRTGARPRSQALEVDNPSVVENKGVETAAAAAAESARAAIEALGEQPSADLGKFQANIAGQAAGRVLGLAPAAPLSGSAAAKSPTSEPAPAPGQF